MRYTEDHKESARAQILSAVGRGFRSHGYAGIGVDGLAKEAGVTSGAFYGYFGSKAEAFQAAALTGLAELCDAVDACQKREGAAWLRKFAEFYLGFKRTCDLKDSCTLQTLTPEVGRAGQKTKAAYEQELVRLVDLVAKGLLGGNLTARRKRAWAILALLSGGVTLARATQDPEVGEQIAEAVIHAILTTDRIG